MIEIIKNDKGNYIPDIKVDDAEELETILKDEVFSEGGEGYKTNKVHAIVFNNRQCFCWINSKRFIHLVVKDEEGINDMMINKNHELKYTNVDHNWKYLKSIAINLNDNKNIYNQED